VGFAGRLGTVASSLPKGLLVTVPSASSNANRVSVGCGLAREVGRGHQCRCRVAIPRAPPKGLDCLAAFQPREESVRAFDWGAV
jgi:hypothetical protein